MQVMPFWTGLLGSAEHNLFNLRTNLRYGCVILRHYLDMERGDMQRALARYNGSLGKKSDYADNVLRAWRMRWAVGRAPPVRTVPIRYLGQP
jgi:soluble lytic murein transglycosylase-like protein